MRMQEAMSKYKYITRKGLKDICVMNNSTVLLFNERLDYSIDMDEILADDWVSYKPILKNLARIKESESHKSRTYDIFISKSPFDIPNKSIIKNLIIDWDKIPNDGVIFVEDEFSDFKFIAKNILFTKNVKYKNFINGKDMFQALNITNIDTSVFKNLKSAEGMFFNNESLHSINGKYFKNLLNAKSLFYNCGSLETVTSPRFDKVLSTKSMFEGCSSLKYIDTSSFGNVVEAMDMFKDCKSLREINTSPFKNVISLYGTFTGCEFLHSVNTESFGKVKFADSAFANCRNLESIDLTYFKNVESTAYMLSGCEKLQKVKIGKTFPIGDSTFWRCSNLNLVEYDGTKDNWTNVLLNLEIGNSKIRDAKVICSDGVYNQNNVALENKSDTSNAFDKNWKKMSDLLKSFPPTYTRL